MAFREEQESSLSVLDPWDTFKQGGMFSALSLEEVTDELGFASWHSKHSKAYLDGWQVRITSPHNALRLHTTTIPHFGFAVWRWMCASVESSSPTTVCASETLSGMLAM